MPWGLAAAAVVGAVAQDQAADKAADASQNATNASIGEQRAARNQYQSNIAPFMQAGTGALQTIGNLNAGDFSAFQHAPDYQFRLDQGFQALNRDAAARGRLNAGGTDADRIAYGQGMASQAFDNFYNKQFNLAAMGQNAIAQQGTASQNTANNIGNLLTGNAANQGAAAMNSANAWAGMANNLAGAYGAYQGRNTGYGYGG